MGRRKKKKKRPPQYDAVGLVRRLARAVLGAPPAGQVVPSRKKKAGKHKKRELERELDS